MALKGPQLYSLTSVVDSGPRFFLTALNKTQWKTKDIKASLGNLFKDLHSHQRSDLAVWDISDMLLKLLLKIQLIIWESIKRMSLPAGVWMRVVAKLTLCSWWGRREAEPAVPHNIQYTYHVSLSLTNTYTHSWPKPTKSSDLTPSFLRQPQMEKPARLCMGLCEVRLSVHSCCVSTGNRGLQHYYFLCDLCVCACVSPCMHVGQSCELDGKPI